MYYGRGRNRARSRGSSILDGTILLNNLVSNAVFDADARVIESYDGVSKVLKNLLGDTDYDLAFPSLSTEGVAGTSTSKVILGIADELTFPDTAANLSFLNQLHKNTIGDYFLGIKFDTGSTMVSNKLLDAASGEGLEIITGSDGKIYSKRRTTLGTEQITIGDAGSLVINTSYELIMTRQASDGNMKVYINSDTPTQETSVPYTFTELLDSDAIYPAVLYDTTDSGWKGVAVVAGNDYLTNDEVTGIRNMWSNRGA